MTSAIKRFPDVDISTSCLEITLNISLEEKKH